MARKTKASRKDGPAPIVINQAVNIPLNKLFLSDASLLSVSAWWGPRTNARNSGRSGW